MIAIFVFPGSKAHMGIPIRLIPVDDESLVEISSQEADPNSSDLEILIDTMIRNDEESENNR